MTIHFSMVIVPWSRVQGMGGQCVGQPQMVMVGNHRWQPQTAAIDGSHRWGSHRRHPQLIATSQWGWDMSTYFTLLIVIVARADTCPAHVPRAWEASEGQHSTCRHWVLGGT